MIMINIIRMSERKVLNKYYPPDFDPSKIPRLKRKSKQHKVRTMAPCNMKCNTCGDYIAKARKFNARKETVEDESYIGLLVYRFYIKCPKCMAEITFKTDPKETDYVVEEGATQNFMASKMASKQAEEEALAEEEEEKINPMKHLENRTNASKNEMEASEQIQNLRIINQRQIFVDFDSLIADKKSEQLDELKKQEEEDEMLARSIIASRKTIHSSSTSNSSDVKFFEETVEEQPILNIRSFTTQKPDALTTNSKPIKRLKLSGITIKPKICPKPHTDSPHTASDTASSSFAPNTTNEQSTSNAMRQLCTYSDSEED